MRAYTKETVTSVHHWNESLFTFRLTRDAGLRFINGQFVMIGLELNGKPLVRAYSIASANYEEHLEFFSIKVENGPLTSHLQHLKIGDQVLVSKKPTGTLIIDDLSPGKRLFMFATGTGLAPFMSLIHDPDIYERFEQVILIHGVRWTNELAYYNYIEHDIKDHPFLGEMLKNKLIYYPTVTREKFRNQGRQTDLILSGKLFADMQISPLNPKYDRCMICGSSAMLKDTAKILDQFAFKASPGIGEPGDYVIERAFAGDGV